MRELLIIAACMSVTACGTSPTWNHTLITDPVAEERQFDIDKGYCIQAAMGSVPMPNVPYIPDAGNGSFSGTYREYNAQSGYTTGQYYGSTSSGGFAGGVASGFATGAAMGAAIRARRAQEDIFVGCMKQLGWNDSDTQ